MKLSIRIALVVTVLALLGSLLISLFSYQHTLENERDIANTHITQLGNTVLRTAMIAVYLDNQEIADDVIKGLTSNEIVDSVLLTSVTGMKIYNDPKMLETDQLSGVVSIQLESPFISGDIIGELQILPKHELIERNVRLIAQERALILFCNTVSIALLVMLVIQYMFVRALKHIAKALHKIEPGSQDRLKYPANHQSDEIGGLVNDINHLLGFVAEQFESERALRLQMEKLERRFRLIFEKASVGIYLMDNENHIVLSNPAFYDIVRTKISCDQDCLPFIFKDVSLVNDLIKDTFCFGKLNNYDLQLAGRPSERPRWVHCLFSVVNTTDCDNVSNTYLQAIIVDISERKFQEQITKFQAERDPLTQLLNRRSMETQLIKLQVKALNENNCFCICLLDLDNFKPINDTYGHEAGDHVLQIVADRIRNFLRSEDIACRLGGDEFLIATIGKIASARLDMANLASKLIATIMEPIELGKGNVASVGVSMGIAISGDYNHEISKLQKMADDAMYEVKKQGKKGYKIYE